MSLIGDIIVDVREKGPDPAQPLTPPVAIEVTGDTTSGTLPAATYAYVFTSISPWGESLPYSPEQFVTLDAPGNITFGVTDVAPGATGFRAYIGLDSGAEFAYLESSDGSDVNLAVPINEGAEPGTPPTRPTGMNPDSDGAFAPVWTIYRWLNKALETAGRRAGGILDTTGVQAVVGNAMYRVVLGQWIRFTNIWFDGYIVAFGRRGDNFLHNANTGIPSSLSMEQVNESSVFQVDPQPSRTGVFNYLAGGIGATDDFLIMQSSSGILPLGLLLLDGTEIVSYSGVSGNQVNGLIRGLAGTVATSHPIDGTVTELNLRLSGYRMPAQYKVGDASKTLSVPFGWIDALCAYVLARYRQAEQEDQKAAQLMGEFNGIIDQIAKDSRPRTGPRQVGMASRDVLPGGYLGGIIVP